MSGPVINLVLGTSTGGVGAHVGSLAGGLLADGWRVRVCGPQATDELFGFSRLGASFRPVPIMGAVSDPAAVLALHRATGAGELIHAHGLRAGVVASLAGRRPLVVTWHNAVLDSDHPLRRRLARASQRLVARTATVNLAASHDLADRARELGARDVRYGPVALTLRAPSRSIEATRTELGLPAGTLLVLAIGRLHPQKGHELLIRAAARWRDLPVEVVIAGDGPSAGTLTAQIEAEFAPVRLLGRRDDVADLLAAADLVVLASRWEARALVAQEALLAGRALVATAVGGLPELLGDGAELIRPDDAQALADVVRGLLLDPVARAELAARGRVRAMDWPTEADTLAQVAALYRELLGRGVG